MEVISPDWLTRRGGALLKNPAENGYAVLIGGEPQYHLTVIPVAGKFGCKVRQTNNGRRLEKSGVYPSEEEAIQGGLADLRKALGW